jgi:vanillate O-demethylase monooxygenase subunit
MRKHPAAAVLAMACACQQPADDVPVDRWQICRFTPPSHVMIEVGVALAGSRRLRRAERQEGLQRRGGLHHAGDRDLDPWYFWGMARKFNPTDKALTASIREGQGKIFSEDLQMLELQQKNLLAYPERALLMLNIDTGGVQSRKILDRLVAAERTASAVPAA